jgi:hypothetical protein
MITRLKLALLSLFLTTSLPAAEMMTPAVPLTPDCRYLIIVDTSVSMARMADSTVRSLHQLVSSGLYGQMKEGEVFTIWTFSDTIQQREFPLNAWIPNLSKSLGNRVVQFMAGQKYRRSPNMGALMNALTRARRICPQLAVLLITDGSQVIVGTPFDRAINNAYGWRAEELRTAKVPFMTVLMSDQGNFVASAVHAANEPFALPKGPDGRLLVGQSNQPVARPAAVALIPSAPVPPTPNTTVEFKPVATQTQTREMRVIERPPEIQPPTPVVSVEPIKAQPVVTNTPPPERIVQRPGSSETGRSNAIPQRPRIVRPTIELSPKPAPKPNVVKAIDVKPRVKTPVPTSFSKQPKGTEIAAITNGNRLIAGSSEGTTKSVAASTAPTAPRPRQIAVTNQIQAVATPGPTPAVIRTAVIAPNGTNLMGQMPQIQVITQLVNVPVPQVMVEIPQMPEVTLPVATNVTVAKAIVSTPVEPSPVVSITTSPVKLVSVAGATTDPVGTGTKAESATTPTPTPTGGADKTTPGTLGTGAGSDASTWIYLIVALGVLTIALLCSKKMLQRPGDPSLISQSMEER